MDLEAFENEIIKKNGLKFPKRRVGTCSAPSRLDRQRFICQTETYKWPCNGFYIHCRNTLITKPTVKLTGFKKWKYNRAKVKYRYQL